MSEQPIVSDVKVKEFSVPPPDDTEALLKSTPESITGELGIEVGSKLQRDIGEEMSRVGFENLKQLCLQNEYEIAGIKFIGQKLSPKKIKELRKIEKDEENAVKGMKDTEFIQDQNLASLQAKAFIHLEMTAEQFEETDVPLLQTIVTARDLRIRGWFRLQ